VKHLFRDFNLGNYNGRFDSGRSGDPAGETVGWQATGLGKTPAYMFERSLQWRRVVVDSCSQSSPGTAVPSGDAVDVNFSGSCKYNDCLHILAAPDMRWIASNASTPMPTAGNSMELPVTLQTTANRRHAHQGEGSAHPVRQVGQGVNELKEGFTHHGGMQAAALR
jgi:hypothetical protein